MISIASESKEISVRRPGGERAKLTRLRYCQKDANTLCQNQDSAIVQNLPCTWLTAYFLAVDCWHLYLTPVPRLGLAVPLLLWNQLWYLILCLGVPWDIPGQSLPIFLYLQINVSLKAWWISWVIKMFVEAPLKFGNEKILLLLTGSWFEAHPSSISFSSLFE